MGNPLRLERAEVIAQAVAKTGKAKALLGFGSLSEIKRLDAYSDLDFLVVAKPEDQETLIEDLTWLTDLKEVILVFRFIADGYKVLFVDGVLCDFGIVTETDMTTFPHGKGRVLWAEPNFDKNLMDDNRHDFKDYESTYQSRDWYRAALVDVYVGLCRFKRGEILAATRLIQTDALNKVLQAQLIEANLTSSDGFQVERRIEAYYPRALPLIESVVLGYAGCEASVACLLEVLKKELPLEVDAIERLMLEWH